MNEWMKFPEYEKSAKLDTLREKYTQQIKTETFNKVLSGESFLNYLNLNI